MSRLRGRASFGSDTVFGNQEGGVANGNTGGPESDTGTVILPLLIAPGGAGSDGF